MPEGYTVADGVLLKYGEPATAQGQLEFIDVLAVMAGEVILTAKTKDKANGKVEVLHIVLLRTSLQSLLIR